MSITSFYTTLSILSFLAVSFSASAALELQLANAQNATSVNLLSYQNPTLGFSIKHPADWTIDESSVSDGILRFKSDDEVMPIFVISINNVTQYLDTDTLTLKNTTIEQSAKELQDMFLSLNLYYKLIRQNDVTVAGNAGIKTEYLAGIFYHYDIFSIINGKLYHFSYNDKPGNVPVSVRLANKVVESFRIIK